MMCFQVSKKPTLLPPILVNRNFWRRMMTMPPCNSVLGCVRLEGNPPTPKQPKHKGEDTLCVYTWMVLVILSEGKVWRRYTCWSVCQNNVVAIGSMFLRRYFCQQQLAHGHGQWLALDLCSAHNHTAQLPSKRKRCPRRWFPPQLL